MKKRIVRILSSFLYFLFCVALSFSTVSVSVSADPDTATYACVCASDAYFYTTRDENRGLFLLPQTYFVKVLAVEGDFSKIEYLYDDSHYKKLTGYAKTDRLTFVDYTPTRPYLYFLFDVRYTIDEGFLYDSNTLNQITVTCAYYGDYNVGSQTYCYIFRGDSFGYIPKPVTLTFEPNPEYAQRLENNSATPTPPSNSESAMSPLQIGILISVCLLVPVLVAILAKSPKRTAYEQEE